MSQHKNKSNSQWICLAMHPGDMHSAMPVGIDQNNYIAIEMRDAPHPRELIIFFCMKNKNIMHEYKNIRIPSHNISRCCTDITHIIISLKKDWF